MNQETKNTETIKKTEKKGLSAQTIVILIILALMVLLPVSVYLWKQSEISKIKKQHLSELNEIKISTNNTIFENNRNNFELLTRVFSWAVRSEMLRNNLEQVNQYMTELIKTTDLKIISVVNTDGIVVLSTDKKYEGNVYPGIIASELSQINKITCRTAEKGDLISITPIMGLDKRLGTLIISYTPPKKFSKPKKIKRNLE